MKNSDAITNGLENYLAKNKDKPAFISTLDAHPENLPEKLSVIKRYINDGDYTKLLQEINKYYDAHLGIKWDINNTVKPVPLLIRDARARNKEVPRAGFGMAMIVLQYARAAERMLQTLGKPIPDSLRPLLMDAVLPLLNSQNSIETQKRTMAIAVAGIIKLYQQETELTSFDAAKKLLHSVKDFFNLEDPHYNVATITADNGKLLIALDNIFLQNQLSLNVDGLPLPPSDNRNSVIADALAALPLKGKVPPSALRKVNGLKEGLYNAYHHQLLVWDGKQSHVLHEIIHSGAVAPDISVSKEEVASKTPSNIKRLFANATKDDFCLFIALNSPRSPINRKQESHIIEATRQGIKTLDEEVPGQYHFALAPTNGARLVGGADYAGIVAYVSHVAQWLKGTLPVNQSVLSEYLDGKRKQKDCSEVVLPSGPKGKLLLLTGMLRTLLNNSTGFKFNLDYNHNLWVTGMMVQLTKLVNEVNQTSPAESIELRNLYVAFACMSGKDRSGFQNDFNQVFSALFSQQADALITEFNTHHSFKHCIETIAEQVPPLMKKITRSGHTQQLSGFQGGGPGYFGLKTGWGFVPGALSSVTEDIASTCMFNDVDKILEHAPAKARKGSWIKEPSKKTEPGNDNSQTKQPVPEVGVAEKEVTITASTVKEKIRAIEIQQQKLQPSVPKTGSVTVAPTFVPKPLWNASLTVVPPSTRPPIPAKPTVTNKSLDVSVLTPEKFFPTSPVKSATTNTEPTTPPLKRGVPVLPPKTGNCKPMLKKTMPMPNAICVY